MSVLKEWKARGWQIKSMFLEKQIKCWGGGQESKQHLPKIPRICKVPSMLHWRGSPSPNNWSWSQWLKCIQTLQWNSREVTFSFSSACDEFTASRLLCALGRSGRMVISAITPWNMTNAKKWTLPSLWKASKNVSTYCLPTLCRMPTLAVCLVLNVLDRPSYKGRECFGPMKGEGRAFLMGMVTFKK